MYKVSFTNCKSGETVVFAVPGLWALICKLWPIEKIILNTYHIQGRRVKSEKILDQVITSYKYFWEDAPTEPFLILSYYEVIHR